MADNLTKAQRSHCMSRVRNRDTDLELALRSELHRRGLRFRKHIRTLPGTPDVVFTRQRVAVFVDGDFWHGYQFARWSSTIPPFWQQKIAANRARDRRNRQALRRRGWIVIRIWQHEVETDLPRCVERIERALASGSEEAALPATGA